MMKKAAWLVVLSVSSAIAAPTKSAAVSVPSSPAAALVKTLQPAIDNIRKQYQLSSLVFSVQVSPTTKPLTIYSGISNPRYKNNKVLPSTLYEINGITKTFVAALMLTLMQEKLLAPTDLVSQWLPDQPALHGITIQQLLNQTSGLYDYSDDPNWLATLRAAPQKIWQPPELVQLALKHSPYFAPGQGWHDSKTNYVLLGLIASKVTAVSFPSLLNSKILRVAQFKLYHTFYLPFPYPLLVLRDLASSDATQLSNNGAWLQAAGAMVSTSRDLARWGQQFFSPTFMHNTWRQQQFPFVAVADGKPGTDRNDYAYSLGVWRRPSTAGPLLFTVGRSLGYRAYLGYLPARKLSFAFTTSNALKPKFDEQILTTILPLVLAAPLATS